MSLNKINLLVAYPYVKKGVVSSLLERKDEVNFLLDSGAFTAWKANKPIELDDYCRFLETLPITPWRYFTLDKIGDPAGSMRNYETMLKRGFKPVPIFTRGEDPSVLNDYYKTSDVVGIGGLVGTEGNKGFVNGIMKHVGKRKVHWLGFTGIDYIKFYKPYMCDSSSWSSGIRYGNLALYTGNGKFKLVNKKTFLSNPSDEIKQLVKKHGIGALELGQASHWINGGGDRALRNASFRAWAMFQNDITKHIGTHFFLACASESDIRTFYSAFDWIKESQTPLRHSDIL